MNILITGGNGFLGSSVAKRLVQEGHSVYIFSRDTSNLHEILPFIQFDAAYTHELGQFKSKIVQFAPDVVVHFGWSGGNTYNDINSIKQFDDNIQPSIEFIQMLSTLPNRPKFIGLGSFAEYGYHNTPISEDFSEKPINLYGLSKFTLKNYSKMLCKIHNMEWGWIRPCYIYGPNDVKTRLIPSLIAKFKANDLVVLDECSATVDYLYIDDFVDYAYEIVTNSTGVFNICSGEQYKLRDVIHTIQKLTNTSSIIKYDVSKNRTSTSNYTCGDGKKVQNLLTINKTTLIKGISTTIQHETSNHNKRK